MTDNTGEPFDPFGPVEGITLAQYAAVCRALTRAGGSRRRMVEVFDRHGIAPESWRLISEGWTERIGGHAEVRTEFAWLCSQPVDATNE